MIELTNTNPFECSQADAPLYRVVQGMAYLFAVETDKDGNESARFSIARYCEGQVIVMLPNVAPDEKKEHPLRFILTGSPQTQIERLEPEKLYGPQGRKTLVQALDAVTKLLRQGIKRESDFEDILLAKDLPRALSWFAEDSAHELALCRERMLLEESRRYAERMKNTSRDYGSALDSLAAVLDGGKVSQDLDEEESGVVRIAKLVAKRQDIEISAIQGKVYDQENGLQELAKDSNIRIRKIILESGWHKRDNGPFVGYRMKFKDDGSVESSHEVALLPEKGGYVCVDTQEKTHIHVDENFVSYISPQAFMFYRPFESSPITFKKLFRFCAKGLAKDAFLYITLGFVCTLVGLLIPELTRMFMDSIIPQAAKNMAVQVSVLVLLCMLSSAVFEFVKMFVMTRMQTYTDYSLQSAVMDRLLKLPVNFFKKFTAGDLAQKTLSVSLVQNLVFSVIISSGMTFIFAFVYLFQLFRYSSYLLKWGLLFSLFPLVITVVIPLLKYKWIKSQTEVSSRISGMLFQFITGVNKLFMTASEKRAFAQWTRLFARQNDSMSHATNFDIAQQIFNSVFTVIVTMFFYAIFVKGVATGKMDALSTGSFMAFLSAYSQFNGALISTAGALTQSVQIFPLYEQAKTVLLAEPEIQESKPSVRSLSGEIEVNHISFRYSPDTPLVLRDISLKITPGEFIAIVGGSGSGKSTLLRILLGFEKQEAGSVFYDNQELDSIDVGSVRRNMGVVLQSSTIMQGSIFTNIAGSSSLSMDDAWKAAEMAGLADEIREMPMGMHTMISDGGGTLSGGQRQRLIIARAIARKPKILIFDEATSALDNKTQTQVSKSLESLKVTRIVIAHRLSTIINADRIYVLNNGVLEESGTYNELMEKGGFFAELAKRQQV